MAHINDCVPGRQAKILHCGVRRVIGKAGVIVEVSRVKRTVDAPLRDLVTVDVAGHGPVVVTPDEVEIVGEHEPAAKRPPGAARPTARR